MDEYIDIVFDGAPGPHAPHFVEVEDVAGKSITMGFWTHRPDNFWALRIPNPARIATLESQLAALQCEVERLRAREREYKSTIAILLHSLESLRDGKTMDNVNQWAANVIHSTQVELEHIESAAYLESEDYKKEMGDDYLSRNG